MLLGRSILVGLAASVVDAAILVLLIRACSVPAVAANLPSLAAGVLVQFLGNKRFAFRDRTPVRASQGARFLAVELAALGLNAALFHLLVTLTPCPALAARLAGTGAVYLLFSFPLWRWVFGPERGAA